MTRVEDGRRRPRERDAVACEEPMEIRLAAAGSPPAARRRPTRGRDAGDAPARSATATVAVTMRTPGHDFELAAGFLYGEGIVRQRDDIAALRYCVDETEPERHNIVNVHLRAADLPPVERLERHFTMTSACGVCGKAHLDAIEARCPVPLPAGPRVSPTVLAGLPGKLRSAQTLFGQTGGLHAAGLFDGDGELLAVREDVGRHNALDKLVGWALLEGRLPLGNGIVCVSGRASFELLQKAVMAGAPVLAAVSAPSSLAVEVAERFGVTLIGFLRDERFNVYSGGTRIFGRPRPAPARVAGDATAAEGR